MNGFSEHIDVYPPDQVGLSARRPFRFGTLCWGGEDVYWTDAGDDPAPPAKYASTRAVEVHVPDVEAYHHIAPHRHAYYEIFIIRQGTVRHLTPDGSEQLSRGDAFVLTPRAAHGFRDMRALVKTNLYIQPHWLFEDLRLLWHEEGLVRFLLADALFHQAREEVLHNGTVHLKLTESEMKACERELADMAGEAGKQRPSLTLFNACLLKVLWVLNQAFLREETRPRLALDPQVWQAAERVEEMIRNGAPFDVRVLARDVGISRPRLVRLLKDATGLSPRDFYQKRRIDLAKGLLQEPESSVTEVAHQLGFADTAHFCRVFKKAAGATPNTYRQQHVVADKGRFYSSDSL
jgi:AraC-like DNA-binding protein/mannose-6-phosphate isomerase-like protein (cupin superfamily)